MNPAPRDPVSESIDLPAPTPWPMVTALGVTLVLAGLITHAVISVVGAMLLVRGAIGWWREVIPHAKHVAIPLRPLAERARPIVPAPEKVSHLRLGEGGHRVRIPEEVHPYWRAGIMGGLVGGAVMAVLAVLYGLVKKGSLWYTVNLLAAAAVPSLSEAGIEQLVGFSGVGLLVGIITHLVLSILIGLLYAVTLPMFPRGAWLWGGIIAPLFWTGLIYAAIGFINPTLAQHIDWWWFAACQVAFGVFGGYAVACCERIDTMQTWPLTARVGLEATVDPAEDNPKKGPRKP
jgi:uncharacterized membrane protein YagU involved in acid resistance